MLLDIKMPKVDGIEVLRRVKGSDAASTVPVVVMTSSNEERDVVESYRLGVNSYIVKPVAVRRLHGDGGEDRPVLGAHQPRAGE